MNQYGKGRYSVIHEMIEWVKTEIEACRSKNTSGKNSPEQIHIGGRLKALNKVLQKLKAKKERTTSMSAAKEEVVFTKKMVIEFMDRYAYYFWKHGYSVTKINEAMTPEDWLNSEQVAQPSVASKET